MYRRGAQAKPTAITPSVFGVGDGTIRAMGRNAQKAVSEVATPNLWFIDPLPGIVRVS